jgi:predicted DsbA family dithiol-disulfide isomerase
VKFLRNPQAWRRPAREPVAPRYQVGEPTEGPPTHSVPPQRVATAAAAHGREAFEAIHRGLLRAYFEESRDISRMETLQALWGEAGLPAGGFERCLAPELLERTAAEHREAAELGVTGVPAVRVAELDAFVLGAQPLETYRRWIERLRAGVLEDRA